MTRYRIRSRKVNTLWNGSYREYIVIAHHNSLDGTHVFAQHYGPFATRAQAQQQLEFLESKEQ